MISVAGGRENSLLVCLDRVEKSVTVTPLEEDVGGTHVGTFLKGTMFTVVPPHADEAAW
jgi:hypothetical protein